MTIVPRQQSDSITSDSKIDAWLHDIGLPQYARLFKENGVDFEILSEVTADHLEEIGVSKLGHRLKLVKAIKALKGATVSSNTSASLTGMSTAQRRHLTIMFCDLVGSTEMSTRLDPEDYRDLMTLYQETVTDVVTKGGGHVAKYLGDGVLIYFGYPIAQEDAAERATRVGLQLVQTIKALVPHVNEQLQIRIGIATGIVVVGDLARGGVNEVSAVAGETPNLAARLQGLAEAGQIVISDKTRMLLGEMFIYEKMEAVDLKGFDAPQAAWRVVSEAYSQERFTLAAGRETLSALVGRDSERERLLAAWDAAKAGSGRVVLISGEAGIGKSRLSHEVIKQASRDKANVFAFQTAPYFMNTAFYAIRHHIEHVLKFDEQTDPEVRLDNLERLVVDHTDLNGARALMASLLSLPTERYPPLNLSPALRKSRTIEMLIEQVLFQSKAGPILLYFEDLHWVDPTSLELLDSFIEKLTGYSVLLVATYRPSFEHDWSGDHIEKCELSRLTTQDIERLMTNLTDGVGLSQEQRTKLLERSDGVPLFAEELIRFVINHEGDSQSDDVVPESLQDSLMARLDKLGETRSLAQIGAAIGREFDIDLLSQLMELPHSSIIASMEQLVDAHLVIASPKRDKWTFRHALLQEAAYRSMLRRPRQALHKKIAIVMEDHFPERCERAPEQVAGHLVAGGLGARSVPYWLTAGKTAWANATANEALAHLAQGMKYVDGVQSPAERAKLELQLQSTIGVVHFAATSYASPQAQAAFERCRDLFDSVDDADLRIAVLYGIGAFENMRGDVGKGHETFAALAAEAKESHHPRYEVYSNSMQAWSHFNRGSYTDAVHHGVRVLELYQNGVMEKPGPRLSAAEPRVISECFRSAALWCLGKPEQALATGQEVIEYARTLTDPYSLVYALANGHIRVLDWTGDWDQVMVLAEECRSVADKFGYGFLGLWSSIWRARALAQNGQLEEAEKITAGSIAACKKAGVHYHGVSFEANHVRQLIALGRVEDAANVLSALDASLEKGGELNQTIELSIVKAELSKVLGNPDDAKAHYRTAMALATERGALSWQLRSCLGMAPLLKTKEDQKKLIAPIFEQFTEGFATKDLKEAQTFL